MGTTETLPPDHAIGANKPPLDEAEQLEKRLELEQAEFIQRGMDLDIQSHTLPERPSTDEEVALLIDWELARAKLDKAVEAQRLATGRPYLEAQRVINEFAKSITKPLDERKVVIVARVKVYQDAKRAKEEADRREHERLERERVAQEQERQRLANEAAAKAKAEADAAAEKIRTAGTETERAAAEVEMRDASATASEALQEAEQAGKAAAGAERVADAVGKTLDGGKLSQAARTTSGGGSALGKRVWRGQITDAVKVLESLGPLGLHFGDDDIRTAIDRAVKAGLRNPALPGVNIFEDSEVNIRASRAKS